MHKEALRVCLLNQKDERYQSVNGQTLHIAQILPELALILNIEFTLSFAHDFPQIPRTGPYGPNSTVTANYWHLLTLKQFCFPPSARCSSGASVEKPISGGYGLHPQQGPADKPSGSLCLSFLICPGDITTQPSQAPVVGSYFW